MEDFIAFAGLFLIAFAAATILPAQSETALVGMQIAGFPVPLLILCASLGNTLGAVVNWVLGHSLEGLSNRRRSGASPGALDRAFRWYRKWGRWSLLLSWLPVGGDALTVIAGFLREPLWSFLLLVSIAKSGRYIVLSAVTAGLLT